MRFISILLCVFSITSLAYGDVLAQQDNQVGSGLFTILIQGQITTSDLFTLIDKSSLKNAKQRLFIVLDSPGGDLGTALKMGNFIRSSNAIVMVPQDAVCLSSCVFLLAAGAKRWVVGKVGIHRPFTIQDDITTEQGQKAKYRKIEAEVKKYLTKVNIPTELYDEMIRIPPSDMRLLTEGELKRFGLSQDDPYLKEAEVTRQSKMWGITKQEYYRLEVRINQCIGLGVSAEEAAQCVQKANPDLQWSPPSRVEDEEAQAQQGRKQQVAQTIDPAKPGQTFRDCPDCPDMVVIPAGSFKMGSNNGDDFQKPVHRVILSRAFALGNTEVTQGEWRAVMGNNPSQFGNCGDDCPVESVSWDDVHEFIQKLNANTGKQYRLPSEAEWEYACRAGGLHEYCGSDDIDAVAWYDSNSGKTTHPVATKQANAFGLYDMSGNVWEWVEDSYHKNYNGAPTNGSVWQGDGAKRVLRGGSWHDVSQGARAAVRPGSEPTNRSISFGFRLVRMLP